MRSRSLILVAATFGVAACASAPSRMHRALDPSMERVLRAQQYLFSVSGISGVPARLARGDGFIVLSDLAPQMRYLANTGDTARYRALRAFVQEHMLRRDANGLVPARAYRADAQFQQATPYGYLILGQAFRDAWKNLGDTASAQLLAQVKWAEMPSTNGHTTIYRLMMKCAEASDAVSTDRASGEAVLREAKSLINSRQAQALELAAGTAAVDGEVAALACLTRLGIALGDPDATVRNLERLLDRLEPLLLHSGRTDLGTTSDILLTLDRVRAAGPRYYEPVAEAR